MTHRLLYFSILLSFFVLFSCSPVQVKKVFEGYNQIGKHSRALYHTDNGFVVGGKDGVYSIFSNDFQQTTDSLKGGTDLRDVYVRSDGSMIFINSGDQGKIWKVSADRRSVKLVYDRSGVFIDGLAFWDDQRGVAYADPVNGKFIVMVTLDGGEIWRPLNSESLPYALPNEAGFAASGTGIAAVGESTIYIGTGMSDTARLYCSYDMGKSWTIRPTPIKPGDSYGIYSMYFWSENEGIIIGGSYQNPDDNEKICFYTPDGGKTWEERGKGLGGYTSCVHGNKDASFLVATGRIATYYSINKGENWNLLTAETYYSVRVGEDKLYFSGKEGKVAVFEYRLSN
ncbi:MAG: hypothetical protein HUJ25_12765 [Crocinitomicaceae bacterium]|nr:hypothetical protein [Crocinitomicaceae bacterium]